MNTEAVIMDDAMLDALGVQFTSDASLGPLTWYGVGGRARRLIRPDSVEQLAAVMRLCHETNTPVRVLGKGANLLVCEGVVPGVVLMLDHPAFRVMEMDDASGIVRTGGGTDLERVITASVRAGLAGFEGLAGIPATIGGALRMNAGGTYGEISQHVTRITLIEPTGEIVTWSKDDAKFGYRRSAIGDRIVVGAEFKLTQVADQPTLRERLKQIMSSKSATQPMAAKSAGCMFRNPPREHSERPAGKLIDDAGLKGFAIGGAEVSKTHANFIELKPGGSIDDVVSVMNAVRERVKERFHVTLEREVVVWETEVER